MQSYPNRFEQELQKSLKPFYLVFGDEPQQKMECIELLRSSVKQQGFDERQNLLVDTQFDWHKLIEATQSLSLFSARQYIELELPTGKPGAEGAKVLSELAQNTNPDTCLLVHGAKIGRDVQNSKWFKALDKQAIYVPCYPLEGRALQQWIAAKLTIAGFQPSLEITGLIADFCEGNLLAAKQEIEKLALLYPDGQVTQAQVQACVLDQSRFNVFQLVDALLSGEAQKAMRILNRLESEGVEATIILWALMREWQTLMQLFTLRQTGENIVWQKFGIWKNRQGLYQQALTRLGKSDLSQAQAKLASFDTAIKQSQVKKPYIELAHLCLLFIPMPLADIPLSA